MGAGSDVDRLRAAIRGRGLRATPSRLAVLGLLRGAGGPMTHGEVAGRLADGGWDRATLYRNLTDLAEAGLLARADLGDHVWRFEAVGGGPAPRHPHFVCTECGAVECLPGLEISVGAAARRRTPRAVRARRVEIQVKGVCDGCG